MEVNHYIEEVEKYLSSFKNQIEDERKEITVCQNKFSMLLNAFSEKAPSNSVINSLFKEEEPEGFVFSKYDEKRRQLAEQRRAEYNAFLEKKDAERFSKKRINEEKTSVSPKSILDSVDYERVLAKRKEEEAKFRTVNLADVLHNSKPTLNENSRKPDLNLLNDLRESPALTNKANGMSYPVVNLPGAVIASEDDTRSHIPKIESKSNLDALKKENLQLLQERISKGLEEQRHQMLFEFESVLRQNNKLKEEIERLKTANSVRSSPQRVPTSKPDEFLKFGRTGGGGDPVRDSYGNLITNRGLKKEGNTDNGVLMAFPSMQQQPIKDRMSLYREELQKQIEEKKRLEALERAKARELEDRIAQRIEEQRLKMQQEYENELKKNNKIKEEFQRQQERIRKLEEFQRKDAEARRKKLEEMKPPEQEKPQPVEIVPERSNSPPIPSVRTKALLEKPPVVTEVKPENVFSRLAEVRRKIMEEQQKPKNDFKKSYEVMNRRTVPDVDDDEDDDLLKTSYN